MVGDFSSLRVVFDVIEHAFCEVVEGDALHEASGDDSICIDILSEDWNSGADNLGNSGKRHLSASDRAFLHSGQACDGVEFPKIRLGRCHEKPLT